MIMENNIVLSDVKYGSHERQRLDILIPQKPKSDSGIILFIHGGGWIEGDKSVHIEDARYFCNQGYISATMNYRYVSESTTVFDQLNDITQALEAIKTECQKNGFNPERLLLSGGSAGAHLSLLYAYTRKESSPVTPVAVCTYCPPVNCSASDFLLGISGEFEDWKYGILSKCCGIEINKENLLESPRQMALKKISPQDYVSAKSVPTAIFYGKLDELIPFSHIEKFINILNENRVKNDLLIYENSGHALNKDPETALKAKSIIKKYAEMYL